MAIRITRIDDIDGSDGAEAIVFQLDRKAYEIDLCVRNKIRFMRAIEPFIERARIMEDNESSPTITRIVTRVSSDSTDALAESVDPGPTTERESGGLDLIEMARQVQG
jgi:hypothetical protein